MYAKKVLDKVIAFEGPRLGRWSCSLRVGNRFFAMTIERCPEIASDRIVFDWIIVEGTAQEREIASGSCPSFRTAGDAVVGAMAQALSIAELGLLDPTFLLPETTERISREISSVKTVVALKVTSGGDEVETFSPICGKVWDDRLATAIPTMIRGPRERAWTAALWIFNGIICPRTSRPATVLSLSELAKASSLVVLQRRPECRSRTRARLMKALASFELGVGYYEGDARLF